MAKDIDSVWPSMNSSRWINCFVTLVTLVTLVFDMLHTNFRGNTSLLIKDFSR